MDHPSVFLNTHFKSTPPTPRQFEDPLQLARVRPSFLKSRFKSTPTTLAVLKTHFKFEWSPHVITRVHTT